MSFDQRKMLKGRVVQKFIYLGMVILLGGAGSGVSADNNMLGSIDANRGDYQIGWDTDQFPINLTETVEAMLVILEAGGLQGGGTNFDAKTRRNGCGTWRTRANQREARALRSTDQSVHLSALEHFTNEMS